MAVCFNIGTKAFNTLKHNYDLVNQYIIFGATISLTHCCNYCSISHTMFSGRKTILFLGAQPDDIVLGAGATIAKLAAKKGKHNLISYTMSKNIEQERQKNLPKEDKQALKSLGISEKNIYMLDFRTRNFPEDRQHICDMLWQIKQKHNPDIVFTHSEHDIHQDHQVMAAETKRVFREKTVLAMEVARSQTEFAPHLFIEVSEKDLNKKIKALSFYKTFKDLNYTHHETIKAISIARGLQLNKKLVEAFEFIRYV